ncbi:hypothetical protein A3E39_00750 [Candidatus Uhrbacteria bacterium RIFCSPHIGHO2_12_FULL_60_25]|uniref:Uncharacterized protein n=1 Tax=Candidatus Uhrbacteria bacterium RIFCSPHIGHO2_12_FULL_60_25 TaxID=1802399 RepID=A0A1F7UPK8_9BACT|nr:MAG: hypothetical protein A3D73_00120 [Candidatus Uhrbacteria bacterium RIFCSPHIGHO2_02_FULL_60_44]OGL79637.1 MAG: hypothetical protein A3E39_00750 [Candidatus Uhrbacteria bacterium RIFCSPHIGHO2_12_FULL_60_25]
MKKKSKKSVRLYDLRKDNFPDKRGDDFRSLQVFTCWVCGAVTNRVVMGGYPGYGVRVICPNSSECWHHELEQKVSWLEHPHPKAYTDALRQEIEGFKVEHQSLVQSDIEGDPDHSLKGQVTNNEVVPSRVELHPLILKEKKGATSCVTERQRVGTAGKSQRADTTSGRLLWRSRTGSKRRRKRKRSGRGDGKPPERKRELLSLSTPSPLGYAQGWDGVLIIPDGLDFLDRRASARGSVGYSLACWPGLRLSR